MYVQSYKSDRGGVSSDRRAEVAQQRRGVVETWNLTNGVVGTWNLTNS